MSESTLADEMRDTALEALNAAKEKGEDDTPENEEVVEDKESDTPDEAPEGEEKEEVEEPSEEEEEKEEEKPEEKEEEKEEEEKEAVDPSLINPPDTWRADAKTKWRDIAPEVRQEIKKREEDAMRGINQYKEKADFGERMDRTVLPYQPVLQQIGMTAEQAVGQSLQFLHTMNTGTPEKKGEILLNMAQMYGADLSVTQDENALKMQQQLQPIMQELNQLRQSTLTQQQREDEDLKQQVKSFAEATNEDGTLTHPFFNNVAKEMHYLIQSGQAATLDDAYNEATLRHPDTREIVLSEQNRIKEAERQEQAKQRTAKAKKNKDVNISKKGHHEDKSTPTGSMRDTAAAALKELRAAS